jgi:hypothetical protein
MLLSAAARREEPLASIKPANRSREPRLLT